MSKCALLWQRLKRMAKISPLMILPPVVFAAFAGLAIGGMMRDNPDELPSTFVGNQAPAVPVDPSQAFWSWFSVYSMRYASSGQVEI